MVSCELLFSLAARTVILLSWLPVLIEVVVGLRAELEGLSLELFMMLAWPKPAVELLSWELESVFWLHPAREAVKIKKIETVLNNFLFIAVHPFQVHYVFLNPIIIRVSKYSKYL